MHSLDDIEILRTINRPHFCDLREAVSDDGTTGLLAAQLSHRFEKFFNCLLSCSKLDGHDRGNGHRASLPGG